MSPQNAPKAVVFDVGGVIVLSPFQAILDYSQKHSIPPDWINFAIARSGPNGHWQRLERGEIKLDDAFFQGFKSDLHNEDLWREFNGKRQKGKKSLKDLANPTQLGDHVSLKAEAADSKPTDEDLGSRAGEERGSAEGGGKRKTLKESANPSQLGDPTSLKAENADSAPTEQDKGSPSNPPSSSSSTSSPKPTAPTIKSSTPSTSFSTSTSPPIPQIDSSTLFWAMMHSARSPDPYIFPALQRLAALPKETRPIIAALSNTVIFPKESELSKPIDLSGGGGGGGPPPPSTPRDNRQGPTSANAASPKDKQKQEPMSTLAEYFDMFISSSEIGMRKPESRIYEHALSKINEFATSSSSSSSSSSSNTQNRNGEGLLKGGDILFLDDIGENLRVAREDHGWRTIKVVMGKTWRAVKELEGVMGLKGELLDEKIARAKL